MKISKLIKELEKIKNKNGDLEIGRDNGMGGVTDYFTMRVETILAYGKKSHIKGKHHYVYQHYTTTPKESKQLIMN